jgi:hypothetical protein
MSKFALIGTITYDVITKGKRILYRGLGGILYQAAVLCAMGFDVNLYTNLGLKLEPDVRRLTKEWKTLHKETINRVPGPGNRVFLDYPAGRERVEVLRSVVPPVSPGRILDDLPRMNFLMMVLNSGFDIELEDWKRLKKKAECPVWLDIHSLVLERKIGEPREYVPILDWRQWVEGIDYLQANKAEVGALLGNPGKMPGLGELKSFGDEAFHLGVKALFLTLGKEGVFLLEKKGGRIIRAKQGDDEVDSTGCGDVLGAGAAAYLIQGHEPFRAALHGLRIASTAVSLCGVSPIFQMIVSGLPNQD